MTGGGDDDDDDDSTSCCCSDNLRRTLPWVFDGLSNNTFVDIAKCLVNIVIDCLMVTDNDEYKMCRCTIAASASSPQLATVAPLTPWRPKPPKVLAFKRS